MQLVKFHQALEAALAGANATHPDARLTIWLTPEDWDMIVDASTPPDYQGRKVRIEGTDVGMLHGHMVRTTSLLAAGRVEIHAVVGSIEIGAL
jgi:hypothetical protein